MLNFELPFTRVFNVRWFFFIPISWFAEIYFSSLMNIRKTSVELKYNSIKLSVLTFERATSKAVKLYFRETEILSHVWLPLSKLSV